MADDQKNPDEYEYPSEEYYKGGEYIPPRDPDEPLESDESVRTSYFSRRLMSIFGILIAVGIVYLILMFTTTSKKAKDLSQPTPIVDTGTASVPPTTDSTQQVISQPPPLQVTGPNPADLAAMAQQNQANQQAMANLQNQIQQLQSQVSDLTNTVSTLTNQIQVLANEARANAIDRSLKGRGIAVTGGATVYTLKALVPGRAWLQSKSGLMTTVSIGDRLPGYGIIQMINPDQGIVTTSSGAIIQYGPKDS